MKTLFSILIALAVVSGFNDIAKINSIKKQAKEAYNNGDYETALSHYKLLSDSLAIHDDNVLLNLANAHYKLKDTTEAINNYSRLLGSNDKVVRSVAHQQLGIVKNKEKKFEEALAHFKESLKADPHNEDSRYNYELLKKVLEEQEKQEQENQDQNKEENNENKEDQQNKDQQNKDQEKQNQEQQEDNKEEQNSEEQNQDQENKEGKEKKEEQQKEGEEKEQEEQSEQKQPQKQDENQQDENADPSLSEKLKEMKISEEKARMILEAMKNNEIQYYQQNKRKAKKKKDSNKPDW